MAVAALLEADAGVPVGIGGRESVTEVLHRFGLHPKRDGAVGMVAQVPDQNMIIDAIEIVRPAEAAFRGERGPVDRAGVPLSAGIFHRASAIGIKGVKKDKPFSKIGGGKTQLGCQHQGQKDDQTRYFLHFFLQFSFGFFEKHCSSIN